MYGSLSTHINTTNTTQQEINIVDIPVMSGTTIFSYTSQEISPNVIYDSDTVILSGDLSSTSPGEHTITAELKNLSNSVWSDSTTTKKYINWEIDDIRVEFPKFKTTNTFTYDGTDKLSELIYDSNSVVVNTERIKKSDDEEDVYGLIHVGDYNITCSLKNPDKSRWEDETTEVYSTTAKITTCLIDIPEIIVGSFTYDGNEKNVVFNYDSNFINVTGQTKGINAKLYNITFSLKNFSGRIIDLKWKDEADQRLPTDKNFTWVINKATQIASLNKKSIMFDDTTDEYTTINVTRLGTGVITITPNNSTVCTNYINNNIITVMSKEKGTQEFSVSIAEDTNYLALDIPLTFTVENDRSPSSKEITENYDEFLEIVKDGTILTKYREGDYFLFNFESDVLLNDSKIIDSDDLYRAYILGFEEDEAGITVHFCIGQNADGTEIAFDCKSPNNTFDDDNLQRNRTYYMFAWLLTDFYNSLPVRLKNILYFSENKEDYVFNYYNFAFKSLPGDIGYKNHFIQKYLYYVDYVYIAYESSANDYDFPGQYSETLSEYAGRNVVVCPFFFLSSIDVFGYPRFNKDGSIKSDELISLNEIDSSTWITPLLPGAIKQYEYFNNKDSSKFIRYSHLNPDTPIKWWSSENVWSYGYHENGSYQNITYYTELISFSDIPEWYTLEYDSSSYLDKCTDDLDDGYVIVSQTRSAGIVPCFRVRGIKNSYVPPIVDSSGKITCTISEFKQYEQDGQIENMLNVGNYLEIEFPGNISLISVKSGDKYKAVVLGINHNPEIEGTNRVHFGLMKNSDDIQVAFINSTFKMNETNTNAGGWASSWAKTQLNSTFYNGLPTDIKNAITDYVKYTDNVAGTTNNDRLEDITSDTGKIFLLSEYEVFGSNSWGNTHEPEFQQQYEYFKNGNPTIFYKHSATTTALWVFLRSPKLIDELRFCCINNEGSPKDYRASINQGCLPCFII